VSGPDEDLASARLEHFKLAAVVRRRSRSGSIAEENRLPGRLGIGTHPGPLALDARRTVLDAGRTVLDGRRVDLGARRAMHEPSALTPRPGPPGKVAALRATSGPMGRLGQFDRRGPIRLTPAGRRRRVGAVSPATVSGSWTTKNRPRLRSGRRRAIARNRHEVVLPAAPEQAGRPGERLVAEMLAVRGLTVQAPVPREPAKYRRAGRLLPVLSRR
jgi:hypothetical protein